MQRGNRSHPRRTDKPIAWALPKLCSRSPWRVRPPRFWWHQPHYRVRLVRIVSKRHVPSRVPSENCSPAFFIYFCVAVCIFEQGTIAVFYNISLQERLLFVPLWLQFTTQITVFHGKKTANSHLRSQFCWFFSLWTIFLRKLSGSSTCISGPKESTRITMSVSSSWLYFILTT